MMFQKISDQYRVGVKNKFLALLEQDEEETTPDALWENVKAVVNETARATVPRQKRKKSPWASEKVFELADQRREVKASGIDSQEKAEKYKELSKRIQHQAREDKKDYISKKCGEIEKYSQSNNSRDMFKNIKSQYKKPAPKLNVLKDANGNILTEDEDIKNRWKEYCEKLYAAKEVANASADDEGGAEYDPILEHC